MERTRPDLCVTVTLRVHAVVCYHSFVYWVSELSPLPQLSVGEQHSKVNNSTSPLFWVAIFKACFRWYLFSISPFFLFSSSSFAFLAISCFLSSSTYLSHTFRAGELKQWKLQQTIRFCGPLHSQKRLRNLLQHDSKIFKSCFIVPRTVSPMLSEMLSMKMQWMTPLMNESSIIKVLPPYKYSNCSLSS